MCPIMNSVMLKGSLVKVLPFAVERGALVYLYQKCPMNFDICSPVKQIAKTNRGGQKNIVQRDVLEL